MKTLYNPIQLNKLLIPGNLFLAPMAGFTDAAFRDICLQWGADLTYTEMVSAEALIRDNPKSLDLLHPGRNEKLRAIQVFTSNPASGVGALDKILGFNPSLIDLNCGCPVPKIVKSGSGAALMLEPTRVRAIVSAMKTRLKDLGNEIPVTVKIRSGWDTQSINFLQVAEMAVEGGADMICLHPRTKKQGYSGHARWQHLEQLKKHMPIPVVGSGDLFHAQDVRQMMESTGCDAVMFARGALGNPFIFKQTKELLTTGKQAFLPSARLKLTVAYEQFQSTIKEKGASRGLKEIKKQFCSYTKGLFNSSKLRNQLVHAETIEEVHSLFDKYLEETERD